MTLTRLNLLNFLPVESVLTLSSEEVDVVLEPKFEDEVLLDGVLGVWLLNLVSQERQRGEGKVVLEKRF